MVTSQLKWLIEEKFVIVNSADNFNRATKSCFNRLFTEEEKRVMPEWKRTLLESVDPNFLEQKEEMGRRLFRAVRGLGDLLEQEDIQLKVGESLRIIEQLFNDKAVPGWRKMRVLSDLVSLHQQHREVVKDEYIEPFYEKIEFSPLFLRIKAMKVVGPNDFKTIQSKDVDSFKIARNYALQNDIRDIHGRTVLEACQKYGIESEELYGLSNDIGFLFEVVE